MGHDDQRALDGLVVLEDRKNSLPLLLAHRTESSIVGSQFAKSFKRGSFEKTSTIGRFKASRFMVTWASIIWFHSNSDTTTPVDPARAVRPLSLINI